MGAAYAGVAYRSRKAAQAERLLLLLLLRRRRP